MSKRAAKPKEPKPKAERKPRAPRTLKVKGSVKKVKGQVENNADLQQDESLPQVRVKEEVRLLVFGFILKRNNLSFRRRHHCDL